jgi:competence protein ComEA
MTGDTLYSLMKRRRIMTRTKMVIALFAVMAVVVGFVMTVGAVEMVNINTASKEELMQLDGVGTVIAERIVEYREANGPFKAPGDIVNVKGIGPATYEKNKDRITVGEAKAG